MEASPRESHLRAAATRTFGRACPPPASPGVAYRPRDPAARLFLGLLLERLRRATASREEAVSPCPRTPYSHPLLPLFSQLLRSWLNDTTRCRGRSSTLRATWPTASSSASSLHDLIPTMQGLLDKETPAAKVQNLTICQQPLLDLGVKFSSKIASELMTETKGTAVQLVYQLKLGLENAKDGGGKPVHRRGHSQQVLLGSTLKPTRTLLSKHEAMEAQRFEALVKQQVQDPKQLAQALSLSRYTEHMIAQQQRDEELDQLRAEQYTAMVAQRRQLELSKLHEGSRLMRNGRRRSCHEARGEYSQEKEDEKAKLRFELSRRSKTAERLAAASRSPRATWRRAWRSSSRRYAVCSLTRMAAATTSSTRPPSVLRRRRRRAPNEAREARRKGAGGDGGREQVVPAPPESAEAGGGSGAGDAEEEGDARARRLGRSSRRSSVRTDPSSWHGSARRRRRLASSCGSREEKEVMRKNRELRDQQLAERSGSRRSRREDREAGLAAASEYRARLEREKERAAENEARAGGA